MARDFDGSDDKISLSDATSLAATTAITIAAWIQTDAVANATYYEIFNRRTVGNVGGYIIDLYGNGSACLMFGALYINGDWRYAQTPYSVTTSGWYAVGLTYDKANIYTWVNGSKGTANAQNQNINDPASPIVRIGISMDDASNKFNGRIAELAMWKNVCLSDAEMASLAKGVCPNLIRPASLGLYMPLWGVASPELDLSGNLNNGTVSGATLYNHAPVGRYVPYRFTLPVRMYTEYINVSDSGAGTEVVTVAEWLTVTDTAEGRENVYVIGEVLIDGLRLDHALRIRVSEPTNIASKSVSTGLPTRIYLGKQGRSIEIEGWVPAVAELNTISALADGTLHYLQLPTGTRIPVHSIQVQPRRPVESGKYPYTISAVEVAE